MARDDEFLVNMFTTSESQTNPKITKLTDGSFVVVWQSNVTGGKTWDGRNIDYEIRGQKFDASGVPVGLEIQIGTDAVWGKTDDRSMIAALAGGKFAVTWNKWTDNGNNVLLRTYDSNALAEQTAPITVSPSTRYQYSSIVSLKDGSYIIAYDSARKDSGNFYNYYRKISPDGTMSEQSRLSSGITFHGGGNGGNSNVELTALDNGGFFATWAVYTDWNALEGFSPGNGQVNYGVHGRIFDSSGNPVGGDFLINAPDPSTHQNGPDTTTLSNGDIVVTWQDSSLEGDGYGIYQQRYTSVGVAKETAPVLVNTVTADNQMDPSVNALTDGGYIISWSGFQSGDYDVYGQRFSSSGQKIGDEFQLNQETSNSQRYSKLSSLDDGSFVATWTSTEQDLDGHGIYARIFDTANAETTSTTTEVIIQNVGLNSTATALSSIAVVDAAIQKVNHQRSQLGAASNRLNHTVNNLTSISANLSAAKGGIEDADFALETTNLAKNQILQQASTAMLAQANASKQNVLSLLQG